MRGGGEATRPPVYPHIVGCDTHHGALDEHQRPSTLQIGAVVVVLGAGRRSDQHPVDTVVEQALQRCLGAISVLISVGKDEAKAALGKRPFRAAHDWRPEVALDAGNDQSNGGGAAAFQAASNAVGAIAELTDGLQYALAQLVADEFVVVDHRRHRGPRDTSQPGDVAAARLPGRRPLPRRPATSRVATRVAHGWRQSYVRALAAVKPTAAPGGAPGPRRRARAGVDRHSACPARLAVPRSPARAARRGPPGTRHPDA